MNAPSSVITYRGVVYPWQCDSMGHLTTRYYMAMFDDASLHFLHEIGFRTAMLNETRIGWADVRHTIEYHRELRAGDLVRIESRPVALGQHSVEYRHDLLHMETEFLHAHMVAKTVQFDLESRRAMPIEAQTRRMATDWLNQAGS